MIATTASDWITPHQEALGANLPYPLPSVAPARVSGLTKEQFSRFLASDGEPVIVTDAMDAWAATSKWTFDFFRREMGDKVVLVADRLGRATKARRLRLDEYVLYCQMPFTTSLARTDSPTPYYLTSFSPFFEHPGLMNDFADPYFVENSYRELSGSLQKWYCESFGWIFIGPKGTLSPLHVDLFGTHAWLAQIVGKKRFLLFPPSDLPYLYDGAVDLVSPDLDKHPLLAKARPVEAVLEPGEVIFIPAGWAHQVISLTASISLTFNFVNQSNYMRHMLAICRDLPIWTKRIDSPDFRQANGHAWISNGFSPLDQKIGEE